MFIVDLCLFLIFHKQVAAPPPQVKAGKKVRTFPCLVVVVEYSIVLQSTVESVNLVSIGLNIAYFVLMGTLNPFSLTHSHSIGLCDLTEASRCQNL